MAGSEQTGVEAARANLFHGAMWLLTPTPRTPDFALENGKRLVSALGATPLILDAEQHDQLLAVTSHVPHLTASALMHLFLKARQGHDALGTLVAGGWRDSTRIAAGSPEMWRDICLANAAALSGSLAELSQEIEKLRQHIESGDGEAIFNWLEAAAVERRKQGYMASPTR